MSEPVSAPVRHRRAVIDGVDTFYREAGPPGAEVLLLPHGYPCSSYAFRNLLPALGDRWRLLAPDLPGFGYSATPPVHEFGYTFDAYGRFLRSFADEMGLQRYALWLHDYGSQFGLQLAMSAPERVTGWLHWDLMDTPERIANLIRLLEDQPRTLRNFPAEQAYLREHTPPALIVRGVNDGYMPEASARAYLRDLPDAALHTFDGGHWLLETHLGEVVPLVRDFLSARALPRRSHP